MLYKYLLFDLDHTLLDFDAAENLALHQLLLEAQVSDIAAYMDYYVPMNRGLWDDLSLGKLSKQELIDTRFARLFAHFDQDVDGRYYAQRYQHFLSQQGQVLEGAKELLESLEARGYRLFAATNGVTFIQNGRLDRSGIRGYFEQVFISDNLGYQKPQKEYYDSIAQAIDSFDKKQALMIGDGLLSDIQGGNNAGIDTVWYNPDGKENTSQAQPTYTVATYQKLLEILD
ncbi:YjjG family noncanonical pyrimidine nucleotidase [Streptococcus dentasini]